MSTSNMTVDTEFRYIVQWFNEWSDFQRNDFISVLSKYLNGTTNDTSNDVDVTSDINSLANDANEALIGHNRPMSLFQCRLKLFRQWHPKWPVEFKTKLQSEIMEIDTKVGEKLTKMFDENSLHSIHECSTAVFNECEDVESKCNNIQNGNQLAITIHEKAIKQDCSIFT